MSLHKETTEEFLLLGETSSSKKKECASPQSKRMKTEEKVTTESVAVAVSPQSPTRPSPTQHINKREVAPNEDETVQDFVFRILGYKILTMLIKTELREGSSFYIGRAVTRYRPVCRAWRDTIHDICFEINLALFEVRIQTWGNKVDPNWADMLLEKLASFSSLLVAPHGSAVLPPVSFNLNHACLSELSYKNSRFGANFLHLLQKMEKMIVSLTLHIHPNSLEGIDWSSLNMENLKHLKVIWRKPYYKNANHEARAIRPLMPKLTLPKSLEKLELDEVKIPMWLIEVAPSLINLKHLFLTAVCRRFSREEPAAHRETLLIANLANSLEYLKLDVSCCYLKPEYFERPATFAIVKPMTKLRSLYLSLSNWKLGELQGYNELLPSLAELKVTWFREEFHFPPSWYTLRCFTMRKFSIRIGQSSFGIPPLSEELLVGISQNFPNLVKLKVTTDDFEGDDWKTILCQGFPNLRNLGVSSRKDISDSRNGLVAAVSGIPWKEVKAILRNEELLEPAISKYKRCPSLRDMKNLRELTLNVCDWTFKTYKAEAESIIMIHSAFLQMPSLKRVKLNASYQLTDEIVKQAIEQTGLIIEKIESVPNTNANFCVITSAGRLLN